MSKAVAPSGLSLLEIHKKAFVEEIKIINEFEPTKNKCLVTDETSYKLLMSVMEEAEVLSLPKMRNIYRLEQGNRTHNDDSWVCVYLLTPNDFTVQCLLADFNRERPRYKGAFLLWTSYRDDRFVQMIKNSVNLRNSIRGEKMLPLEFYPRESNLFTTREPTSFFNLYHTECQNDQLIDYHLRELARKIVCVCQALEEDTPIVRYGHRDPTRRDADGQAIQQYDNGVSRLAKRLAIMVQQELDRAEEERHRNGIQPPERKGRPQGVLFIVDRTLDLFAPLLHEFTYQAMAHDLLPIKDGEEISYNVEITTAEGTTERKDMPITDGDKLWIRNRHQHMKDTIERLMEDFNNFLAANKNFTGSKEQQNTSLHAIRDMMATLPEFQKQKDEYSLHLTMAQECMGRFEKLKLADVALLEQSLSTGYDEQGQDLKRPATDLIRLLDDPALGPEERVRLIALYALYRDGLLEGDIVKLIRHAALQRHDEDVVRSLEKLGARVVKSLKDSKARTSMDRKPRPVLKPGVEQDDFCRYTTAVKSMLDGFVAGNLDDRAFPYVKPELAQTRTGPAPAPTNVRNVGLATTWSRARPSGGAAADSKQRVIVFVAGGATYSEARACYETSQSSNCSVYLGSTHLLTPGMFLRQLSELNYRRGDLHLPGDQPPRQIPKAVADPDPVYVPRPTPPPQQAMQRPPPGPAPGAAPKPPTAETSGLKVHHQPQRPYYEVPEKKKKKRFGMF